MKTSLSILCIACLLLAACGDTNTASDPATDRSGLLLTTELPPAALSHTPAPIKLPPRTPGYGQSMSGSEL